MEHGAIGEVGHCVQLLVVMENIQELEFVSNNMEEEIVLDLILMYSFALPLSVHQVLNLYFYYRIKNELKNLLMH